MIVLTQLRGAERKDFSDVFAAPPESVWLTIRRLESPDFALARRRTYEAIAAAKNGRDALAAYGFDKPDDDGAYLDVAHSDTMTGVGLIIAAVEIGMLAIGRIEGIEQQVDRDGVTVTEPAEVNRANLAMLMRQESCRQRFMRHAEELQRIFVVEKKGSGASPPGSSQAAGTSAPNTALDAGAPTAPAAAISAVEPDSSALP